MVKRIGIIDCSYTTLVTKMVNITNRFDPLTKERIYRRILRMAGDVFAGTRCTKRQEGGPHYK